MKSNELRIGNWVYNQTTIKHMQVYPMMIPQLHRIGNENGSLDNCNIKPIPLTEEILLKCGFENEIDEIDGECYNVYFVTNTDYLIEYFHKRKEYVFTDDMGLKVPISSIHQLQNLYFAITGEELEINL